MKYICFRCRTLVKSELCETGEEYYCECQHTIQAEFDIDLWERIDV